MATASVVLHVFTTLNKLSFSENQARERAERHASVAEPHSAGGGASNADSTEGGAAGRFPFSVAAQFRPWTVRVLNGKIRSPEVCGVSVPTPGERVPVPRKGAGVRRKAKPCSTSTHPRQAPSSGGKMWGGRRENYPGSGRAARRGAGLGPIWRRHPSCSMFSQRLTS